MKQEEKPKQETLEEAAEKYVDINYPNYIQPLEKAAAVEDFIAGAKWQADRMYSYVLFGEEDMISFAEFVATYTDKNRNVHGQMLHAKSKYDGAERTVDLFKIWFEQFKNK